MSVERAHFFDADVERNLLGALIAEETIPDALRKRIDVNHFSPANRTLASAVLSAFENHDVCDVVTVAFELKNLPNALGEQDRLMRIAEHSPVGANLDRLYQLVLAQVNNGQGDIRPFTAPLSQLLSAPDEPIPYLADGLIVQSANGFIGGEPKSLKSWVALHVSLCLSLGVPIFGRYEVPKRVRVLAISEEDGERRVRFRIRKLLRGMGMDAPIDDFFRYAIKAGVMLDDPKWVSRLRAEMAEHRPGIVIGDVFELLHGRDGDKRADMKPVFRNMDRLREDHGCGFLLADHFKKVSLGTSKRGGQRLSGTVGKHAWGECSLYLFPAQGKNRVRVETELKDGPCEAFGLSLEDTEDGGVKFVWHPEAEDREAEGKVKILEAVEGVAVPGEWVKTGIIAQAAGVSENTARKYLETLADVDGTLERERRTEGRAKPYYWRLRPLSL